MTRRSQWLYRARRTAALRMYWRLPFRRGAWNGAHIVAVSRGFFDSLDLTRWATTKAFLERNK